MKKNNNNNNEEEGHLPIVPRIYKLMIGK